MSATRPRFLLDTDVLSYAIKGHSAVNSRLLQHAESWALSSISAAELHRYATVAGSARVAAATRLLLEGSWIIEFDSRAAFIAGDLLASKGLRSAQIGFADTLIAAHAIQLGVPLVTNNQKHFSRVPGLRLQNWLE